MHGVDMLVYNGSIITVDQKDSIKEWMCIDGGRIIDLGCGEGYKDYIGGASEIIDLEGKTVLPGFYDSHINMVQAGVNTFGIDLGKMGSLEEVLEAIREAADKTPPGELIRGMGFGVSRIKERRFPVRQELDACAPNNPVWINSLDYHSCSVNSLMLHKLNVPFNLEGISRDKNNVPLGCFTGKANALVVKYILASISDIYKADGVEKVIKLAVDNGVTSAVTFEGGFVSHESYAAFILENRDTFPIDVELFFQTVSTKKAEQLGIKRVGDLFLDGTFSARTAAISFKYLDSSETNGVLYFTQEEVNDFVLKAHREGMQLSAHCIGDRAIEQIITAYEYAQCQYPRNDHRHRIEHCELFRDDLIERARALNLVISMQPIGEHNWGGPGKMYEERLGQAYRSTNPFRKILQSGLKIAGGTDYDVLPMDPLFNMHVSVNHPVPESRINIGEAIRMYTINGAYAIFEENEKGSLEVGKLGDFVILDKNPITAKSEEIKDIKVVATVKEGNILFMK